MKIFTQIIITRIPAPAMILLISLMFSMLLWACEKDEKDNDDDQPKITGFVQKGPFESGAVVTLEELDDELGGTGRIFTGKVINHTGAFEVESTDIESNYVLFRAQGKYFNEVGGSFTPTPIELMAVSDLSNTEKVNINIMTHLEKSRIENLAQGGMSFADARKKAQREVLAAFGIVKNDIPDSESLDIN
jgi:hypothetical protein